MLGDVVTRNRNHPYNAQVVGSFRDSRARHRVMWSGHKACFENSVIVGLCEAFERHAGLMPRAKHSKVYDTYAHVESQALDPRELGLYASSYYASHADLVPFSEDLKLQWVWGYSLTEERPILVPEQFAYYGYDAQRKPRIIHDNSNGCASGSCLEEAVFHGLLELIERDAFVIHWHARLAPPKLDIDTINDPEVHFLIQRLRLTNLDIYLLDTRLDIPVPSVTAVAVRRDGDLGTLALAAGCSFDPESAIASALGEVASHHVGLRNRVARAEQRLRPGIENLSLVQTMEDHNLLYGFPEALPLAEFLMSSPTTSSVKDAYLQWNEQLTSGPDLRDDISYCLRLLRQAGLPQAVVVDQTSPEELRFGLRTVRVIVPGLMPLDFGFGRCRAASLPRMYSVPVDLGHRATPATAADLYYVPHPFP